MLPVGPLVEPPDDVTATLGPSAPPASAGGYDYAINDMLFKLAISDDRPYQRATAQFRKDQLDTGSQSGDQSLTGWWTRGEFSFHHGAGVTYYDAGSNDAIVNRYDDAEGVYPWRVGELTCQPSWQGGTSAFTSLTHFGAIGTDFFALDGGVLKYGSLTAPSSATPTGGGTVLAMTTSPSVAYFVTTAGNVNSISSSGTQENLYSGLTSTARGIWYAKSRLIVSDSDGKWYQLATTPASPPVTVGTTDVIFTAGVEWQPNSVVCDTPGPVLIANDNRVFALTLDSTGTIPTLSAPVQIGELPPGETVSAITSHLGFVVLVTGAGVRCGVLSDSGQLTYGPLLMERETPTVAFLNTTVAKQGTRVLCVIEDRIIEIDLAEQIGESLEFAWTGRGLPFTGEGSLSGVVTHGTTRLAAWRADNAWKADDGIGGYYMPGYLTTGLHRFGTLEDKWFDSVVISADGDHGTIAISKVDANGTAISLYTMDVSREHQVRLSLGSTGGAQAVALRFDLNPDYPDFPSESPVLLGYQLRALPQPERQRMIRVPLNIFDKERRGPALATGHAGNAWERLRALEDLERTRAVVAFRDYRTRESGTAMIESLEFVNTTPPSATADGFGGFAALTLRKL